MSGTELVGLWCAVKRWLYKAACTNVSSWPVCAAGANLLIPVPGDSLKVKATDAPGPGGVLVCAENFVFYMHEGHDTIQTLIPRRSTLPGDRAILLLVSATHKMRNQFVVLAQSEYGDIYKARTPLLAAPA